MKDAINIAIADLNYSNLFTKNNNLPYFTVDNKNIPLLNYLNQIRIYINKVRSMKDKKYALDIDIDFSQSKNIIFDLLIKNKEKLGLTNIQILHKSVVENKNHHKTFIFDLEQRLLQKENQSKLAIFVNFNPFYRGGGVKEYKNDNTVEAFLMRHTSLLYALNKKDMENHFYWKNKHQKKYKAWDYINGSNKVIYIKNLMLTIKDNSEYLKSNLPLLEINASRIVKNMTAFIDNQFNVIGSDIILKKYFKSKAEKMNYQTMLNNKLIMIADCLKRNNIKEFWVFD